MSELLCVLCTLDGDSSVVQLVEVFIRDSEGIPRKILLYGEERGGFYLPSNWWDNVEAEVNFQRNSSG